ncbi:MAG: NUDIX hydrolase [Candidatus Pacebacteria bacterium]|nr:NUDIX hydrolase [Candidatus Paceibacterota bacterium]
MTKEIKEAKNFINLGIILNDKNEVLMIKRRKPEKGRDESILIWAFPGGKQRYNETREECVRREVLDETGYDITSIKQISLTLHDQFPVMIVYHLCRLNSKKQTARPKEPHEISEIRWVRVSDIKNLITTKLNEEVARELKIV